MIKEQNIQKSLQNPQNEDQVLDKISETQRYHWVGVGRTAVASVNCLLETSGLATCSALKITGPSKENPEVYVTTLTHVAAHVNDPEGLEKIYRDVFDFSDPSKLSAYYVKGANSEIQQELDNPNGSINIILKLEKNLGFDISTAGKVKSTGERVSAPYYPSEDMKKTKFQEFRDRSEEYSKVQGIKEVLSRYDIKIEGQVEEEIEDIEELFSAYGNQIKSQEFKDEVGQLNSLIQNPEAKRELLELIK